MPTSISLTEQLQRFSSGDREVAEAILREVLPQLHAIAVRELNRERYIVPLQPTELINEVWLSSLGKGGWQVKNRQHFYAIACLAMRRVLIDFARSRLAQRRGDGQTPLSLDTDAGLNWSKEPPPEVVLQIGLLLDKLEKADPEGARIVDMHYFAGFTLEEVADILGLTFRQVRHRWKKAQDWLKDRMDAAPPRRPLSKK